MIFPNSRVSAYDTSREARELCKQMAETNGTLDRTGIYETCTATTLLDEDFSGGGLIICDCEGYEGELFDEEFQRTVTSLLNFTTVQGMAIKFDPSFYPS